MAHVRGWGRGALLAGLVLACSGLDGPPIDSGKSAASAGSASVYLHGDAPCGGVGATSSGGGATGGSTPLPSDFAAGTSGSAQIGAAGEPQGTGGAPAPLGRAFFFSEYVEGSSTYKALEITAALDSSFEGCRLALYFNGGTTPTGSELEGTLLAGDSYVICSSALGELLGDCDLSAGLTFNGDDAIALECDGAVVDVIGQIGFDPGTAWGSGDLSLADHTLQRSCAVASGDTNASDAFDPAGEWSGLAQDSFDDLGARSCDSGTAGAGGAAAAALARAFVFTEYVEGSSTYKALEITALSDSSFDGCRIALYFNGSTTASGSDLEGALLEGDSYVVCSSALTELIGSCDRSAGLTFNGDDAIALECDGLVVDVIGQIGLDPGTAWGSGDLSLLDHTLRRSCAVIAGDQSPDDAFDPSAEWTGFAQDSFEDLGTRSCE